MYGNLLLTIGGTIQQILENLQLAADERLIEPLWRMQVLVDRASRAQTDEQMDRFDEDLLKALRDLRHLRDHLRAASAVPAVGSVPLAAVASAESEDVRLDDLLAGSGATAQVEAGGAEVVSEDGVPAGRYSARRLDARLAATL